MIDSESDRGHPVARDAGAGRMPGAEDRVDLALLGLSKLVLSSTIRAGTLSDPALSPTQIRTLSLLAEGPPDGLSVSTVALRMSVSAPSASRICQRLVRDGLVDRAAGPGNELRLSLSDAGVAVLGAVNHARTDHMRALLDALPEKKRRSAVDAFEAIAAHVAEELPA